MADTKKQRGLKPSDDLEEDSDSSYEDHIDNMEEEDLLKDNDPSFTIKTKSLRKKNALDRALDTNADDLEERENEADDTVFIDNLPRDERGLREMIKEVNYHIRNLEQQFFEEEDSEEERVLKQNLEKSNVSVADYNQRLENLKEKSHIQQFWTIPMSESVTNMAFDQLAEAQMKHGGRLFDVITCDPPW